MGIVRERQTAKQRRAVRDEAVRILLAKGTDRSQLESQSTHAWLRRHIPEIRVTGTVRIHQKASRFSLTELEGLIRQLKGDDGCGVKMAMAKKDFSQSGPWIKDEGKIHIRDLND